MNQIFPNLSDETELLAGIPASSRSGPAAQVPVILILSARRRPIGAEDEIDPIEGFESVGSISTRLVAQWSLPSCKLLRLDQRGK